LDRDSLKIEFCVRPFSTPLHPHVLSSLNAQLKKEAHDQRRPLKSEEFSFPLDFLVNNKFSENQQQKMLDLDLGDLQSECRWRC
jgi:hypothetical protein